MRSLLITAFVLFGISISAHAQKAPEVLKTSFEGPGLEETLVDLNGNVWDIKSILESNKGKKVLLYLWASWCPDCLNGFPQLFDLQKANPDVQVVFFSWDRQEENWRNCIEKFNLKGDHYWFGSSKKNTFTEYIDLDWIPRYILIDKEGQIAKYYSVKAEDPELQAAIDLLD